MRAQFLYNPPDVGLYCHCPSLLETRSGDLLAVWYAYPDKESEGATLVLSRRTAGQTEWERSSVVLGPFHDSVGNPLLFQEPGGGVWLFFVRLKGSYWDDAVVEGAYSEDDGRSWSSSLSIHPRRGMMVRHPPLFLEDGSFLLPAYHERTRRSLLLRSRGNDARWEEVHRFRGVALIQPSLVRVAPGRLAVFFRPWTDPRRIWRSQSNDEGATWSAPVQTTLPNPLSGISAFMAGEGIAVIYNHTDKHQRHPLSLARSFDGGLSWEGPWHFDANSCEICYPSFFCDPEERRISGVYTYNRRMIKFVSFRVDEIGNHHEPDR